MADPNFAKQIIKKVNVSLGNEVRTKVVDFWNQVTIETPVLTGRLRANWNISTSGTPDRTDSGAPSSPDQASSIAEQKIRSQEDAIPDAEVIFVTNNVSYLEDVNTGSADRPGQKFIERALKTVFGSDS
jgi:hypothetical protein